MIETMTREMNETVASYNLELGTLLVRAEHARKRLERGASRGETISSRDAFNMSESVSLLIDLAARFEQARRMISIVKQSEGAL